VRLAKIEQLSEKRLAPPFAVPMALIIIVVIIIPALLEGDAAFVGALVGGSSTGTFSARAFDDLIEFAAIQPNAATLGAIIDFDTLALGYMQVDLAGWTFHGCMLFSGAPCRAPENVGPSES
jgi:hypothetical protein